MSIPPLPRMIPVAFETEIPDFRPRTYWPSSASVSNGEVKIGTSKGCLRSQYYHWNGFPRTRMTDNARCNTYSGNAIHEMLVEAIKRLGIYAGDERRIYIPELQISGRVDCLIYDHDDNIIPVEIKSVWGSHGRKGVIETGIRNPVPFMPKDEHILQTFLYLDFYSRTDLYIGDREIEFPYALIFYFARDNGFCAQHVLQLVVEDATFEPTEGVEWELTRISVNGEVQPYTNQDMYNRYIEARAYIESDTLPPRDWTLQYSAERIADMDRAGELSKTDSDKFRRGRFVEKGDWQCLTPDTPVVMENGEHKRIRYVREGDMTILGKVTNVATKDVDEKLIRIEPTGIIPIRTTTDHLIYMYNHKSGEDVYDWFPAGAIQEMAADWSPIATIPKGEAPPVSEERFILTMLHLIYGFPGEEGRMVLQIMDPHVARRVDMFLDDYKIKHERANISAHYYNADRYKLRGEDVTWVLSNTRGCGFLPTVIQQMEVDPLISRMMLLKGIIGQSFHMQVDALMQTQRMMWRAGINAGVYFDGHPMLVMNDPAIAFCSKGVYAPFSTSLCRYRGSVYDLTIKDQHMIQTAGILVHNCGYCDFQPICYDGISRDDLWEGVVDPFADQENLPNQEVDNQQ